MDCFFKKNLFISVGQINARDLARKHFDGIIYLFIIYLYSELTRVWITCREATYVGWEVCLGLLRMVPARNRTADLFLLINVTGLDAFTNYVIRPHQSCIFTIMYSTKLSTIYKMVWCSHNVSHTETSIILIHHIVYIFIIKMFYGLLSEIKWSIYLSIYLSIIIHNR